ncbi:MAG: hypothetical protein Q4E73_07260 [Lachnospiraceae bacterium]|nr:hypothetical protein [Lachnospiraceae bacterium]
MKKIRINKSKEEWIHSLDNKVETLEEGENFFKNDYNKRYHAREVCMGKFYSLTNQFDFYYSYNGGKGVNLIAWFHGYLDENGLYLEGKAKHRKGFLHYVGFILILVVFPLLQYVCGDIDRATVIESAGGFIFLNFIIFLQGRYVIRNMMDKLRQI